MKTRRLVFTIDCPELLQKITLKISFIYSKYNPPFVTSQSKTNYFTNSPVCHLSMVCNKINNFDFFFFDSCIISKTRIHNLNNWCKLYLIINNSQCLLYFYCTLTTWGVCLHSFFNNKCTTTIAITLRYSALVLSS